MTYVLFIVTMLILSSSFVFCLYRLLDAHLYFKHEETIRFVKRLERDKKVMDIRARYQ